MFRRNLRRGRKPFPTRQTLLKLLLSAYPDRVCRRHQHDPRRRRHDRRRSASASIPNPSSAKAISFSPSTPAMIPIPD